MSATVRLGSTLRHSQTGERLVVWSPGPGSGTYWCHALDRDPEAERAPVVLARVSNPRSSSLPVVSIDGEEL